MTQKIQATEKKWPEMMGSNQKNAVYENRKK
jgi:hypothetical protein